MQQKMNNLQRQLEVAATRALRDEDLKVTRLSEEDNIEVYLTTFVICVAYGSL